MLITNAEIRDFSSLETGMVPSRLVNVRVEDGRIQLTDHQPLLSERVIDADGGLLLPGLNDHHMHFMAFAASLASIDCGPPAIHDEEELKAALAAASTGGWIRGTGYAEQVAGDIDRAWLDTFGPAVPIRIQQRSGRLWIFNSLAIEALAADGVEVPADGRFYDQDHALPRGGDLPPIAEASRLLASYGVTGLHDMTPANDSAQAQFFAEQQHLGNLHQRLRLSGSSSLRVKNSETMAFGETKFHLHDSQLPDFDTFCGEIKTSHQANRGIAVHCVTELALVYTLSALTETGVHPQDRLEHASVVPPALIGQIRDLGLPVITQPNFIGERGDAYRRDLPAREHESLYRSVTLRDAGIPVAFGTDTPFGSADPWRAMASAVSRQAPDGLVLGEAERESPEYAIAGFLGDLSSPDQVRKVTDGAPADLCLMDCGWDDLRDDLASSHVRLTICRGDVVFEN